MGTPGLGSCDGATFFYAYMVCYIFITPYGIKYSLNKYFPLPLGGIGKHFNTDIPTVAIPGGSAMMIKYVFV